MQKRGISPLIATILLIGFTIVLAALIMVWGTDLFKNVQEEQGMSAETELFCTSKINPILQGTCSLQSVPIFNLQIKNDGQEKISSLLVRLHTENEVINSPIKKQIDSYGVINEQLFYTSKTGGNPGKLISAEIIPSVIINGKEKTCKPVSVQVPSCGNINTTNFNQYSTIISDQNTSFLANDLNGDGIPDEIFIPNMGMNLLETYQDGFIPIGDLPLLPPEDLQGTPIAGQTFTCFSTSIESTCSLLPYFTVKIISAGDTEIINSILTVGTEVINIPLITKTTPYTSNKINYLDPTTANYNFNIGDKSCPQVTKSIICNSDVTIKTIQNLNGNYLYYKTNSSGDNVFYKEENNNLVIYAPTNLDCSIIKPTLTDSCSSLLPYYLLSIQNKWPQSLDYSLELNNQVYKTGTINNYLTTNIAKEYTKSNFDINLVSLKYKVNSQDCTPITLTSKNCNTVTFPGLVSFWDLNEGTGIQVKDLINSNNGQIVSVDPSWLTSWVDGISSKALDLGFGKNHIDVQDNSNLDISNDLTIGLWIKTTQNYPGYASHIINKGDLANLNGINYVLYHFGDAAGSATKGKLAFYAGAGNVWKGISGSSNALNLNQWYHVILSYDSVTGGQLYIDGIPVGSRSGSGALSTNNINLHIGGGFMSSTYPWQTEDNFKGVIDNVVIYNRALTDEEVKELYESI